MHDPALDLAQVIESAGVATLGVNMFTGLVRPVSQVIPAECIFVRASDGVAANRFFSQIDEVRYPAVQIRVRSPSYEQGLKLVRNIYKACQSSRPVGYMDVRAMQSEPIYLEQDDNRNHQWALNFELVYQE